MAFSDTLRGILDKRNMKAAELAKCTGLSEAIISNYLSGTKEPRMKTLQTISAALEIPVDELLNTGENWWNRKADILNEQENTFLNSINQFTPDEKIYLLARLNSTLENISKMECLYKPSENNQETTVKRFSDIISAYGYMMLNCIGLRVASKESPHEYLAFLQNYEKCIQLINEHKSNLLETALVSSGNPIELHELIYGKGGGKSGNGKKEDA